MLPERRKIWFEASTNREQEDGGETSAQCEPSFNCEIRVT